MVTYVYIFLQLPGTGCTPVPSKMHAGVQGLLYDVGDDGVGKCWGRWGTRVPGLCTCMRSRTF